MSNVEVTRTQPCGLGVQCSLVPHFCKSRVSIQVSQKLVLNGPPVTGEGAGESCPAFSGIRRKFPEQKVRGKRWI